MFKYAGTLEFTKKLRADYIRGILATIQAESFVSSSPFQKL
jgi:hypothetical protein